MEQSSCVLCETKFLSKKASFFCCMGCETVHKILSARNELTSFKEHPLFQEALKVGLISNPTLLTDLEQKNTHTLREESTKIVFEIQGMWCPSCAEIIKYYLLQKEAIYSCSVDYVNDLACVEFSLKHYSQEQIFKFISSLGYQPAKIDLSQEQPTKLKLSLKFVVAAFCSLNIMMFAYPLYATYFNWDSEKNGLFFAWLSFYFSLPVVTFCSWPIYRRFYLSLLTKQFGMESLVVLGVVSAFGLSTYELFRGSDQVYFDSMSVIVALVLLGKLIENQAKFKNKQVLLNIAKAIPRKVRKFIDGAYQYVPTKEIQLEDEIVVCHGEKVALDGTIVEGEGYVDESVMTGEPHLLFKALGSHLISGSILSQGWVRVKVTSLVNSSTLAQILQIVEKEITQKPTYKKLVDLVTRWFVPFVVMITFTNFLFIYSSTQDFSQAFLQALSILLISCPCAIGIAAPIAESHLIQELAQQGMIIRDHSILEYFPQITTYVFDKTGTITEGRFEVLSGLENLTSEEKKVLKGICARSNHSISASLYKNLSILAKEPDSLKEIPGNGLSAMIENNDYFLGSKKFLESQGIPILLNCNQSTSIKTYVYFAKNTTLLAVIELGDKIKEGLQDLLLRLQPAKTILLSGDSEIHVKNIAHFCGFMDWKASCTPLEKKEFIDQLKKQGEIVCMIGDGINDAPALAAAHLGISVKNASDLSSYTSNILLTTEDLQILDQCRVCVKKGLKILKQNLFWAFFYNLIGIALALYGGLTPIFSAIAMTLSSLIVILNAKRIRNSYNWGI